MLSIVTGKVVVETFYFYFFLTDNDRTDQILIAIVITEVWNIFFFSELTGFLIDYITYFQEQNISTIIHCVVVPKLILDL